MKSDDKFFHVMEEVERLQLKQKEHELQNESQNELINKTERKIIKVIEVFQFIWFFVLVVSPFVWIWIDFTTFSKVFLSGMAGLIIFYYLEKWVKDAAEQKRNEK